MKRYRKLFMLKTILIFALNTGYGQFFEPLQIGDTIPEAFYKEVKKLGSAGEAFSKTKGKLTILDFWSIYCGTCIESLPKMAELQKEFDDNLQIFLVNTFEDSKKISNRMKIPVMQKYNVDLPIIADAKVFQQLFPHSVVPHHVWIDGDGIVKVIGSSLNTNRQKIMSHLNGEEIFSLKNSNNSNVVDEETSLHEITDKALNEDEKSSFLFSSHLNDYSATSSRVFVGIINSGDQVIRDTYINNDVMELYKEVYYGEIASRRNKMIYSGSFSTNTEFWRDFFIVDVSDTSSLTSQYTGFLERTDQQYVKSRFCYEQLIHFDNKLEKKSYMLNNLNEYFRKALGIEGLIIEREVKCYILKSANKDRLPDKEQGRTLLNAALAYPVYSLFSENPACFLSYMIDETGLENVNGLKLPDFKRDYSFQDIVDSLNEYGIIVEEEVRHMNFILIKDTLY